MKTSTTHDHAVKSLVTTFVAGLLFALGLGLAGMTDPGKIIGFLDVTGDWDPTMLFVMGGAAGSHFILYRLVLRRKTPIFAGRFGIPTRRDIDLRLVGGAALFGLGFGLAGNCPGPALVQTGGGAVGGLVFVVTMLAGMAGFHAAHSWYSGRVEARAASQAIRQATPQAVSAK